MGNVVENRVRLNIFVEEHFVLKQSIYIAHIRVVLWRMRGGESRIRERVRVLSPGRVVAACEARII